MKKHLFFYLLFLLSFFAEAQFLTGTQLRLRNNTDSVSTAATTNGTIRYDLTSNKFRFRQNGSWVSFGNGSGTIGGSTGATDNSVLKADGTGGSTVQNSSVTITDLGVMSLSGNSTNASEIRLFEDTDNGTDYSAFRVGIQSANLTYTLPTAYPISNGYSLTSTTSGVMSWTNIASIGGSTGGTDERLLRSDGTGGATLQNSFIESDDLGETRFLGTNAQSARIKLFEDTDNGTNFIQFTSPSSLSSNYIYTLPTSTPAAINQVLASSTTGTMEWVRFVYSDSFSQAASSETVFTVNIGSTMTDSSYKVNVTSTSSLGAALFYVTNKTTTTFDVVYLSALTGTVTFDWVITIY